MSDFRYDIILRYSWDTSKWIQIEYHPYKYTGVLAVEALSKMFNFKGYGYDFINYLR